MGAMNRTPGWIANSWLLFNGLNDLNGLNFLNVFNRRKT
jgi:hypothetical protein